MELNLTNQLYHTIPIFNDLEEAASENVVSKGEKADNQHFLHFPQCFLFLIKQNSNFQSHSLKCFQFGQVENFVVW